MRNLDPSRAEEYARLELAIQRLDFDLVTEALKSVPSRAGPVLGAALVVAGLGADYIYRLKGSVAISALVLCGILAAASFVWSIVFASLALTVVNIDEPAPLLTPTAAEVKAVQEEASPEEASDEAAKKTVSEAEVFHIRARVRRAGHSRPTIGNAADALIEHSEAIAKWNTNMTEKLDLARVLMISSFGGLVALTSVVILALILRLCYVKNHDPNDLENAISPIARSAQASAEGIQSDTASSKSRDKHIQELSKSLRDLSTVLSKMKH